MRTVIALSLIGTAFALAYHAPVPAQTRAETRFAQADSNGDGKVSREEFKADREKLFATRDRNGDGYFDANDIPERMTNARAATRGVADANGDGKLDKKEFVDGALPIFDRADTNHDGTLDAAELKAAADTVKGALERRRGEEPQPK